MRLARLLLSGMGMADGNEAIEGAVEAYFHGLQGESAQAFLESVQLPFTVCTDNSLRVMPAVDELLKWWKGFMQELRTRTGMARAEIKHLHVERLSSAAAIVRTLSARIDVAGAEISEHKTAFILYRCALRWRVSGVITDISHERPP